MLWNDLIFFKVIIYKLLTENPIKLSLLNDNRSIVMRHLWHQNLWEKVAITVKLCFTETRLKQGYDLQGYFLKTKETINILTITVIIFLNEHLLEAVNQRCSAKKLFLKFYKIYSKKPVPVAYNFIQKETLLQVFEFCETFRDTFFNRTPHVQCLLLVPEFSFKYIDLSIILY